jgi:preprotein translocase SecE subunit
VANKMSEKKKSASQGEMEEPKARASEKELKSTRAAARDDRLSKPARREVKPSAAPAKKSGGFRNWAAVRFVREAYRELRYKVTWPTFQEARNMTLVVIVLSTVIGLILGLTDQGLFHLFQLVTHK